MKHIGGKHNIHLLIIIIFKVDFYNHPKKHNYFLTIKQKVPHLNINVCTFEGKIMLKQSESMILCIFVRVMKIKTEINNILWT